ncbi:hypothetical protein J2S78_002101 [Salibacterium salarium]|nr:hypothetical protein [Salibacterium salarium]MDQ0299681.1 hypothetical protein [Salibacterium salarium]
MDTDQIQNQLSEMKRELIKMNNRVMDFIEEIEKTERLMEEEEKDDQLAG